MALVAWAWCVPPTPSAAPSPTATPKTHRCGSGEASAKARELLDDGHYLEGERLARQLLARAERSRDSLCMAEASDLLAEALLGWSGAPAATYLAGRFVPGEAIERAAFAVRVKEAAFGADAPILFESLVNHGHAQWLMNPKEAGPILQRAIEVGERSLGPDHPRLRGILSSLIQARLLAQDVPAADSLARRYLALCEAHFPETHPARIRAHLDLADAEAAKRRPQETDQHLAAALRILDADSTIDHPEVAIALGALATRLAETGRSARAWTLFDRTVAMVERRLPDSPALVRVLYQQAWSTYTFREQFQTARGMFERGLRILEAHPGLSPYATLSMLKGVAWSCMYMDDVAAAAAFAGRAIAFHDSAGVNDLKFLSDYGGVLQLHAYALGRLGEVEPSCRQLERRMATLELRQQPDHPDWIVALGDLARCHTARKDLAGARTLLERALALAEEKKHEYYIRYLLMQISYNAARLGDTARAVEASVRSERMRIDGLRSALRTRSEQDALRQARTGYSSLDVALHLAAGGRLRAEQIREIWDAVIGSRAIVLDEMTSRRRDVAEVARRGGASPEVAAEIARRSQVAAAEADRLARLAAQGPGTHSPDAHRRALEEARERKTRAEFDLAEASDAYRRTRVRERAGIEPIIAALPPKSALVAYHQFHKQIEDGEHHAGSRMWGGGHLDSLRVMVACVLRGGERDPVAVPLGRGLELDSLVRRWGEEASAGTRGPIGAIHERLYRRAGEALRRRIWDPIAPHLAGVERVYLVPDGALQLVNWATLPVGTQEYLVERGPLLHILSAERDLLDREIERSPNRGILALGGASFDGPDALIAAGGPGGGAPLAGSEPGAATFRGRLATCRDFATLRWSALPGTIRECEEIAAMWGPPARGEETGASLLLGAAATEAAFKARAGRHRVVHVATHGFFVAPECLAETGDDGVIHSPLSLSGLALAGANRRDAAGADGEDGVLTAEELGALDLGGVEWVVLSACETGVGHVRSGEGVLGLRRAVQIAGARTLIMSLWAVDDEATRAWMGALYQARLKRGRSTADAVRDASRTMLASRRAAGEPTHPFTWGAFVAIGDWR